MFVRSITTAAALSLFAGAAIAQSVSMGERQLALSAGVEPGVYSTSELIRLLEAEEDNDAAIVNFIKSRRGDMVTRSTGYVSKPLRGSPFGNGDHNEKNN